MRFCSGSAMGVDVEARPLAGVEGMVLDGVLEVERNGVGTDDEAMPRMADMAAASVEAICLEALSRAR